MSDELKVLKELLAQIDGKRPNRVASRAVGNVLWGALFALFLVIFSTTTRATGGWVFLATVVGVMLGAAAGIAMVSRLSQQRWPMLREHVDRASVVARIEELQR